LSDSLFEDTTLIVGADLLYGHGRQTTLNGNSGYTVPLDGSVLPPPVSSIPVTEIGTVDDHRLFAGQYAQVDWKLGSRWDVLGGIRLNEAYEHKKTSDLVFPPPQLALGDDTKTMIRPTEILGASYRAWSEGKNEAVVFADVRNAFKPAAIDFGPDFTPDLLSPETTQSYEFGVKGAALDGRLKFLAELFQLNFHNLVVRTDSGALANAAGEKLKGVEAEVRYQVATELEFAGSASYHDAAFTKYLFFDGLSNVDVAGRQLTLSPHVLASAGILYTPAHGPFSTVVARYVGRRFLDPENIAAVGGYSTLDANVGYGFGRVRITLEGTNLTDQRPPVTSSEFGSQSFYLLPARMTWVRIRYSWT
jgi:outer membrane receptor protein involved in Fe transport